MNKTYLSLIVIVLSLSLAILWNTGVHGTETKMLSLPWNPIAYTGENIRIGAESGQTAYVSQSVSLPCIYKNYVHCVTQRVSIATDGTQANDWSSEISAISVDGGFVAFGSEADNLVAGDNNGFRDIFVRDLKSARTEIVSVASNGSQGNEDAMWPAISGDGRYVTFHSRADNLVSSDTNGWWDAFVHDRQTGETRRISVASNGAQGDKGSGNTAISSDGRYVAFSSIATNLVSGDTNDTGDIFIHDLLTGRTKRVSKASNGVQANGNSNLPSLSSDGRYVAFTSVADNLVNGDTNGFYDVFVHDRQTGETTRISVATDGTQGNEISYEPSISGDGRYVSFWSEASNLVIGDTNGETDIFVHDRLTSVTRRVSVASNGSQGNGISENHSISGDGQYVVFDSESDNLVSSDTNGYGDIFLYDLKTGEVQLISVNTDRVQGNVASFSPSISFDGRIVVFASSSTNLVAGDTNNKVDLFVTSCR